MEIDRLPSGSYNEAPGFVLMTIWHQLLKLSTTPHELTHDECEDDLERREREAGISVEKILRV